MIIKILGSGCSNCKKLQKNTEKAIKESGVEAVVEKVTDMSAIAAYGVLSTPGLVVDEKVVSTGKVLTVKEIIPLISHQ